MERRLSIRKPIEREVILYYPGVGMLCCLSRDLSMDGIFLQTRKVSIPSHIDIELAFNPDTVARGVRNSSIRFGGYVVRSHADGIAVNFTKFHEGAFAYLKKLMAE